jgi:DNA-directed RNA polymerase beta subunit
MGKTKETTRKRPNKQEAIVTKRDISTSTRPDDSGQVTSITNYTTPSGSHVTVGITTHRPCEVGEKLTNRTSGKGILGALESQEDLPYSLEDGSIADLYASPLSFAARMTLTSLLESLTGKCVALTGDLDLGVDKQNHFEKGNAHIEAQMASILVAHGFSCRGTETFVCGKTGKMLRGKVFVGLIEVARLNHIASKKVHARDFEIGPRDPLTRQPKAGRINGGGPKMGEMEVIAMASYGASHNIQTRINQLSDPYTAYICQNCKMLADGNKEIGYTWCRCCQSKTSVLEVQIPHTFLVSITELLAMGIVVRIAVTKEDIPTNIPKWNEDVWLKCYDHIQPC